MNTVQEGYQEHYEKYKNNTNMPTSSQKEYAMRYVMQKGKGQLNPFQVEQLILMETTMPDENGFTKEPGRKPCCFSIGMNAVNFLFISHTFLYNILEI